jgi:hypothetical protein
MRTWLKRVVGLAPSGALTAKRKREQVTSKRSRVTTEGLARVETSLNRVPSLFGSSSRALSPSVPRECRRPFCGVTNLGALDR